VLWVQGITTYEYVVAMRAQNESPTFGDGEQSMASSHSSSAATGMSGSSSVGLQYRGGWCTPPRIFVEHQDEILPHLAPGRVPSTKDPDAMGAGRPPKRSSGTVRISAWRLAKLNADEAARAAAKARENSSVLKPLGARDVGGIPETDYSSSSNISSRSSLSIDYGLKTGLRRGREDVPSALPSLQSGLAPIRTGRVSALPTDLADAGMENKNSVSSNSASSTVADSIAMSPHPTERKDGPSEMLSTSMADTSATPSVAETSLNPSIAETIVAEPSGKPIPSASSSIVTESGLKSSRLPQHGTRLSHPPAVAASSNPGWAPGAVTSDGYEPSGGESADEVMWSSRGRGLHDTGRNTSAKDIRRSSVFWNRPGMDRFGADPRSAGRLPTRIEFGGRGVSTSIFQSQQIRHGTWLETSMSPSSVSNAGDMASSELSPGKVSAPQSPAMTRSRSPLLPSGRSQTTSHAGTSIFYDGPILPVRDTASSRRHSSQILPPKPPLDPRSSGVHKQPGPENRSSSRGSALPVFTPSSISH
jgi:hypothetical protein